MISLEAPDGRRLLNECARLYSHFVRYRDKGRVELHEENVSSSAILFETYLDRHALCFYFRFAEPLNSHVRDLREMICECGLENGKFYFSKSHSDGAQQVNNEETLGSVVARATGLSYGASHHIARLLFPEIGGFTFIEMRSPIVREIKDSSGVGLWEISGSHPYTDGLRVVMEKESLLIREYSERSANTGDWTSYLMHSIEASPVQNLGGASRN